MYIFQKLPEHQCDILLTDCPLLSEIAFLKSRLKQFETIVDNFPGGISLFDDNLQMVLCNEQQKSILEYPDDLMVSGGLSMEDLFRFNARRGEYGPGNPEDHVQRRMALARRKEAHCYDRERPNGEIVEVRGFPLADGGFVTTYLDVTQQRRDQQLVAHLAQHDPLTDLPNRALFSDRLQNALAHARRGGVMALHYLDLDKFKPVNDLLGHKAGDEILKMFSERLRGSVRETDTVARLGGDEFAIIQTLISKPEDAVVLAERLSEAVSEPFIIEGKPVSIGLSIGIAMAPDDALTSDDLLIKADSALYQSKRDGRNRVTFYQP